MNQIFILTLLLLLLILVRCAAITFINSDHISKNHIHDICHRLLPTIKITKYRNYAYDFYTMLPIIFLVGLLIYSQEYGLLLDFTTITIILNLLRPIFYAITIVPDPIDKDDHRENSNSTYDMLMGSCKDMIFSGHVSNSLMALLFLMKYFNLPVVFAFLHQAVLILWMLCQKRHYTIDIIVAYLVTIILFDHRKTLLSFLNC